MAAILWDESLSIGISTIDRQHRVLIEHINRLDDAVTRGAGRGVLEHVLKGLASYVSIHFTYEETLMKVSRYRESPEHHDEHEHFKAQVAQFQRRFQAGDEQMAADLLAFMQGWLRSHIQIEDQRYAADVIAHGHR